MVSAQPVSVSKRQKETLQNFIDSRKTSQQLAERARIVIMSAYGISNNEQSRILNVDRQRIRRWRDRWASQKEMLLAAEANNATDKELAELIKDILSDEYRSGAPQKFTAEQVAQVLALACESPEESGIPISHWTPPDLTRELLKRGIFDSISPRSVERFLKGGRYSSSQDRILDEAQRRRSRKVSAKSRACM